MEGGSLKLPQTASSFPRADLLCFPRRVGKSLSCNKLRAYQTLAMKMLGSLYTVQYLWRAGLGRVTSDSKPQNICPSKLPTSDDGIFALGILGHWSHVASWMLPFEMINFAPSCFLMPSMIPALHDRPLAQCPAAPNQR